MSKAVLDTSAILAVLNHEPGASVVLTVLHDAILSTVNLAEVITVLSAEGVPGDQALAAIKAFDLEIVDFTVEQARTAGDLRPQTKPFGLSLGDRACLSVGLERGLPIYNADRIWAKFLVSKSALFAVELPRLLLRPIPIKLTSNPARLIFRARSHPFTMEPA